ncbi:MAG: hypothetical protein IH851_04135 [Armatimonadetes bacterium]|nr:hypothetical protein [Armatimonadota bacterium]
MPPRLVIAGPSQVGKTRIAKRLCEQEGHWFLNLDPARQDDAPITCAGLLGPGGERKGFRFLGSLRLVSDPIAAFAAVAWAHEEAAEEPLVCELPIDRPGAVHAHLLRNLVTFLRPQRMIVVGYAEAETALHPPDGCELEHRDPDEECEARTSPAVAAWRKATWKSYFARAEQHDLPLARVRISGARHGSGAPLDEGDMQVLRDLGLPSAQYAEVIHGLLHVVIPGNAPGAAVTAALDHFGCSDAHLVHPDTYRGLVCGLEDRLGRHFAVGRIIEAGFRAGVLKVLSPAESPAPAARVHLGRLRLDDDGNEIGELRAWQV